MNNALNYIINLNNGTFGRGITEAQNQVSKLDGMVSKIGVTIATTLSAHAALDLISEVTQLKAKFEGYDNVIRFASGSQVEYATNTKFLTDVIDGMNLPLEETTDAFAQWAGSIKGTTLEGELGRKVFLGVSAAGTTMHLSGEKVSRTFMALSQMMGKGKVQAEELRGQLGEALPGAFNLAAKAMGVTTSKLNEMLDKGQVLPEELLPKLASELLKTFGPGVENAAGSTQAKINEVTNSIKRQKLAIGEELIPVQLGWMNLQLKGLEILQMAIKFYNDHKTIIDTVAVSLATGTLAYYGYLAAVKIGVLWTKISYFWGLINLGLIEAQTRGLKGWAAAQHALNIVMSMNPIGILIVVIAALVGGVIYAYTKFEKFRAVLDGVFGVIKALAEPVWELVKALFALSTGNIKGAYEGFKNMGSSLANMDLGDSYNKAYNASLKASAIKKKEEDKSDSKKKIEELVNLSTAATLKGTGASTGAAKTKERSSESVSGQSVKTVNIHIGKQSVEIGTFNTNNMQNLKNSDIEKALMDLLIKAAHDSEIIIGNN